MALYTYSDFENEAKRLGHFDTLSKADINLAKSNPDVGMSLLKYVNDYSIETNTSKQKQIENSINQIRQNYGGYTIKNRPLHLGLVHTYRPRNRFACFHHSFLIYKTVL